MRMPHRRVVPPPIGPDITVADLIDQHFLAYNSARLYEACRLFVEDMLSQDTLIGVTLSGALTPAGLGIAALVPLIERGYIDYIISTGANLYHDLHFALDMEIFASTPFQDDPSLRQEKIIRIYDLTMGLDSLLKTDKYLYTILSQPEFQKVMGTAELHWNIGRYVRKTEEKLGLPTRSILSAAYQQNLPIYTSSPGDSTIGMNVAAMALLDYGLQIDPSTDVNETTAILYYAKRKGAKSGVLILGGGSPKNFILQTEPQLQEIMSLEEEGHNYFIQITDARPDTGGLSGATPSEAITWGKVAIEKTLTSSVAYVDATVALPLLAAYAISRGPERKPRQLYSKRAEMMEFLKKEYLDRYQEIKGLKNIPIEEDS
jgi:deoxyhypusine synthase